MKKNYWARLARSKNLKKTYLIMKFWILLMILSIGQLSAEINAQNAKISMDKVGVSMLEVIKSIEKQSEISFVYSTSAISKIGKVSVKVKDKALQEVMEKCLKGTNYTYLFNKNVVVIKPKTNIKAEKKKENEIKGKVVDKKGKPLPGVTVQLDGVSMGTATDINGNFKMKLPMKKGVLIFSFVGYKTQKVKFEAGKPLKIKLVEERSNLDEVTVTAYGTTTKREMTGSITTVKGEALKDVPVANLATALQGRIAGMDIQNMSGAPGGSGVSTVVRGYNSLSSETRNFSSPLWVIDGIPVSNMTSAMTGTNALAEIDPSMIESIEVLKDASAAALYGSRAANGVILVTTKKGRKGEAKISANVSYSYSFVPEFPTITAGVDARRFKEEALRNSREAAFDYDKNIAIYPGSYNEAWKLRKDGKYGGVYDYWWKNGDQSYTPNLNRIQQDSLNSFYNNATNWFDVFFKAGKVVDANLQARGGNENLKYSLGLGYYSEDGIMENSGFDRATVLASLNFKPVKRATLDFRVFGSYSSRKRTGTGKIETIPDAPFEMPTFLPGEGSIVANTALQNLNGVKQKNNDFRLRANFSILYEILKGLNFKTMNSIDYAVSKYNRFTPSSLSTRGESSSYGGMMDYTNFLSENILNFNKSINGVHNIDVLAGFTYQTDKETTYKGWGYKSPSDYIEYVRPGFPTFEDTGWYIRQMMNFESNFKESILVSLLGRVKYNYDKKYLFEASIRRDGSSKFGKAIPWGTFPSASAGWVFSEESFMDFLPQLDFAKVRASWGISGMQFEQPYRAYGVLTPGSRTFQGNTTISADIFDGLLNTKLSWEETTQYNLGLDLDLFNYKLGVIFDYYYRYTDGLLYNVPFPGDHSYFVGQWQNAAAISNEGMELTLKWDVVRSDNLTWKMNFNIAKNWNQFRESVDGRDISKGYTLGKPVNGIYVLKSEGIISDASNLPFRYSTDGIKHYYNSGSNSGVYRVGDTKYVDYSGDAKIDPWTDVVYMGSPLPKAFGGLLNEIKWKNFDVNFLLTYSLGRTILNTTVANTLQVTGNNLNHPILTDLSDYTFWQKPGDITDFPRNELDKRRNNYAGSDRFIENNIYYVKLKNIIIGYKFPKLLTNKMGIRGARLFFSGENLLTITNYTGIDSETVNILTGVDKGKNYPLPRKFTVGLTVNF